MSNYGKYTQKAMKILSLRLITIVVKNLEIQDAKHNK